MTELTHAALSCERIITGKQNHIISACGIFEKPLKRHDLIKNFELNNLQSQH